MLKILKSYILSFIVIFSSIIAIYYFMKDVSANTPDIAKFGYIIIGFFAICHFLESLYLKSKWGRNTKYGEVLSIINEAYSNIHHLKFNEINDEKVGVKAFSNFCDAVSKSFSIISGVNCAVTIKLLERDSINNKEIIETMDFCRNRDSIKKRHPKRDEKINHSLQINTDFHHIFENFGTPKGDCFFSNRLPLLLNYSNSSFKRYGEPTTFYPLRLVKWPLPYKSTIVVPICPKGAKNDSELIGYLCVDCKKMFAFKIDYDVDLLKGISDGIFEKMNEFINQYN